MCLQAAQDAETRMIATDGVFSMDGDVAKLDEMCRLADAYDALVMVDECHATGFMGEGGRGASEAKGVLDEVDIITSTLGKALGGATGGFTTGRKEIIDLLRQESRPYLFSNAIAPMIANASLKVLEMLQTSGERREQIWENARYFRSEMEARGFEIKPGDHPIVPIMFYDDLIDAIETSESAFAVDRERVLETLRSIRADEAAGVEAVTRLMERQE